MKVYKQNSRILIGILLMVVMVLPACSKIEGKNYATIINPIEEVIINTAVIPTESIPTQAIKSSDDVEAIAVATNELKKSKKSESKKTIKDNADSASSKKMIAIDAGHQSKGNNGKEPIGPGSSITKPKVSSGTQGVISGVAEYQLNLIIAKKVKNELINRGYKVYMIREKNDVNLSNKKRAAMANKSGADLFLRIHADSSSSSSVSGTSTLYPSKDNPYVSNLSKDSHVLSDVIVDAICKQTGAKNRGAIARDDMSGINWCTIPVTIIEMGFLSNKKEDKLMQTKDYQDKIVKGICDGIDEYYE